MTKIISILISLCIILNACNKKNSDITQTITRTNQSEQSDEEQSDEEQSDEEQSDEQDSKSKKSISNTPPPQHRHRR